MRTTLTIDTAVAQQLRAVMRKQKLTLKEAVNEALRAGIPQIGKGRKDRKPFTVVPHDMGLKPGIDPDKISRYADEMHDAEKLRKSLH
jgi:Spy/CpxP family protein refolding chaperone